MEMHRTFQGLVMFVAVTFAATSFAKPAGVVATVNGQQIKEAKLQKAVESHLKQQGTNVAAIRDPRKYKKLREDILDILIGQKLLWLSAQKDKLIASDEDVDKLFTQFQSQYPSKAEFLNKMKLEGYDEKSYRQELKQQISAKRWVHENVIKNVKVESKDIHEFYTSNKEKFTAPEMVHARHILIKLTQDATKKDKQKARKQLSKIKKELKSGASFEELAKKYSQGPSGPNGGDLGFFPRGKMVKPFDEAVFKLKEGKVSGIVETRFGYHLIKVIEKQDARKIKENEVASRIQQHLLKVKSESALTETIARIKAEAKIEKHNF